MKRTLSKKEILGYRQWLSELDEEAREPGGDLSRCDGEIWEQFDPVRLPGKEIYASFTENELLDKMIETMHHQGHSPRYDQIYCIYKSYIVRRFGALNIAKEKARRRMHQLRTLENVPDNWQSGVCVEPLLQTLEQKGRSISDEDVRYLEELCEKTRKTGIPPYISIAVRKRLDKIYAWSQVLSLMGIPAAGTISIKEYNRYWLEKKNTEEAT